MTTVKCINCSRDLPLLSLTGKTSDDPCVMTPSGTIFVLEKCRACGYTNQVVLYPEVTFCYREDPNYE